MYSSCAELLASQPQCHACTSTRQDRAFAAETRILRLNRISTRQQPKICRKGRKSPPYQKQKFIADRQCSLLTNAAEHCQPVAIASAALISICCKGSVCADAKGADHFALIPVSSAYRCVTWGARHVARSLQRADSPPTSLPRRICQPMLRTMENPDTNSW